MQPSCRLLNVTLTTDLVEAFLKCPTKCFLRARAEVETGNAYADWVRTQGDIFRSEGIKRLVAGASLTAPMMRGVALKDFYWEKNIKGEWEPRWCAIGQGMVHFLHFFEFMRERRFSGPIQLRFEYPEMGGANLGKRTIAISRKVFIEIVRRDLTRVRTMMRQAGLRQA
jgi:hypothetical protein